MGAECCHSGSSFTSAKNNKDLLIKLLSDQIKPYEEEFNTIRNNIMNGKPLPSKERALLLKEFCNGIDQFLKKLKEMKYKELYEFEVMLEQYFQLIYENDCKKIVMKTVVMNSWLDSNNIANE